MRKNRNAGQNLNPSGLSGEAVLAIGSDGRCRAASAGSHTVMGFAPGDLLGRSLFDYVCPEDLTELRNFLQRNFQGEGTDRTCCRVRHEAGHYVFAEISLHTLLTGSEEQDEMILAIRDAAERLEPEERLNAALEWKKALFEGSRDAIFVSDEDASLVDVNLAACKLTGYSREALLGMTIPELHDPADLDAYHSYHQDILKGEETVTQAFIRRPDGSKVATEFNNRRMEISGKVYMHTVARDISERIKAQENLTRAREQLETLIETANVIVVCLDQDGFVRLFNGAAEKITEYRRDDLIGKDWFDIVVPRDRFPEAEEYFGQLLASPLSAGQEYENPIITRSGQKRFISWRSGKLDSDGQPLIISFGIDVTARVQAIDALRSSETKYRTILESASEAIVIARGDGPIEFFNRRAEEIFGYARDEVLGRDMEILLPHRLREMHRMQRRLHPVDSGSHPAHSSGGEFFCLRKNGDEFPAEIGLSFIESGGGQLLISFISDISARKEAEKALRESEEQYRALVEHSCDPIYVLVGRDGKERFGLVNPAWELLLGYSSAEVVSSDFDPLSLIAPASRSLIDERVARRAAGVSVEAIYEFQALAKDGRMLDLEASVAEITWHGEPALQGMYRDITNYKAAERRLRLSDEILKNVGALVLVADENGEIVYVGPSVKNVLGFEPEELLGDGWWKLTRSDPEQRQKEKEFIASVAKGDVTLAREPYERKVSHRNGESRYILWQDAQGPEGLVIGVGQDITDLKRTEEQLLKVMHAVEQSPVSVVITDPEGRIEYVNPKFCETTGYAAAEVVGQKTTILESGEMPRDEYQSLWASLRSGKSWQGEFHSKRKGGELFWEKAVISPVKDAAGSTTHLIGIKEDITLRKSLEEQLRQSQKMEAVGKLAGGIAHDFNNIVTAICGYSDFALAGLDAADPVRRDVEEIKKAGDQAASLTRQLLAFSRKQVLRPSILNLNAILRNMTLLIRRVIPDNIILTTEFSADLWHVKADPGQLEQAILNLVINAKDAMPGGGRLNITTSNVPGEEERSRRSEPEPDPQVMVTLTDSGCGMDEETCSRIFEPFYTTKGLRRGTGLGLSTSYGIIKQSGGQISVSSELGAGTTFRIYLPRVDHAAEPADPRTEKAGQSSGEVTILFVEDEETIRSFGLRTLNHEGYKVLAAPNGTEALSVASQYMGAIHLLVTDVIMPGLNGQELARRLSVVRPETKVLYISGYDDNLVAKAGSRHNGASFLAKPFDSSMLVRKVRQVLDGGV